MVLAEGVDVLDRGGSSGGTNCRVSLSLSIDKIVSEIFSTNENEFTFHFCDHQMSKSFGTKMEPKFWTKSSKFTFSDGFLGCVFDAF